MCRLLGSSALTHRAGRDRRPGGTGRAGQLPRLLDSELGCWVGVQALVRDWQPAADRAPVGTVVQSLQSAVESAQPVAQALGDGVVHSLGGQRLGSIASVSGLCFRVPVLLLCRAGVLEEALHLFALSKQPRSCLILVHLFPSSVMVASASGLGRQGWSRCGPVPPGPFPSQSGPPNSCPPLRAAGGKRLPSRELAGSITGGGI